MSCKSRLPDVCSSDQKTFFNQKQGVLGKIDFSKKGAIDTGVLEVISIVNRMPNCFTTSSCAGRVLLFCKSDENKKKGCFWLFTSHQPPALDELYGAYLKSVEDRQHHPVVLKFEPLILHVRCRNLFTAKQLMGAAVTSGYRNSGLTIGKGNRTTVAFRSTLCLEIPLTEDADHCYASKEYFAFLTKVLTDKFRENDEQKSRLINALLNLDI